MSGKDQPNLNLMEGKKIDSNSMGEREYENLLDQHFHGSDTDGKTWLGGGGGYM